MSRELPKVCVSCSPAVSADCFLSVLHLYSFPISWPRKDKMLPDLKFPAAAALSPNLPLGSPSSLAASAIFAPPQDLYKQAEHKGWRGHRGRWWMLSCSLKNKLHFSPLEEISFETITCSEWHRDIFATITPRNSWCILNKYFYFSWKLIKGYQSVLDFTHQHIFVFATLLDLWYQCPAHLSLIIFMTFSLVPPVNYHHNVRFMKSAAGDRDVSCLSPCELNRRCPIPHERTSAQWRDP